MESGGAGDGIRTHDILLGKQTLCQLSYTRKGLIASIVAPELVARNWRLAGRELAGYDPEVVAGEVLDVG